MSPPPLCFLFDNGSLRATATLSLREVAAKLEKRLKLPVRAVSLLHSSAVEPAQLQGTPAELLEPALRSTLASGTPSVVLLPLFFGLSAALTDYLPARIAFLREGAPGAQIRVAAPLVDLAVSTDRRMAEALAERVRECLGSRNWRRAPQVVLVDHGSPQRGVTGVRNFLGTQLQDVLGADVAGVTVASMERREGSEYDFNDPLLAKCLRTPPCDDGDVIVALQFLSAGRHAGPGGDVAQIAAEAVRERPGLSIHITEPIGCADPLIDVLVDRFHQACGSAPVGA